MCSFMKTRANNNGRTVMVVDDEPGNRRLYCEILSGMGYGVIDKPDGSAALASVREGASIDLVVTDYRMPDMTGLDLVMALRQVLPSVPVIMITAYASVETYLQSLSLGVFEYINKPFVKREFERIVKAALRRSGRDAA
jgi:CheY-like chemotaxis protein